MAAFVHGDTPRGLNSNVVNLANVLTRKATLEVPRYQRRYSWGEREVRRLLLDLLHANGHRANFYFIGQIVLVKNEQGKFEISDGQQRLATLTMILAYVRERLPHRAAHYQSLIMLNEGHGGPRLVPRDDDVSFYRRYVQEPAQFGALCKLDETGVDSRDLMCIAARTVTSELADMGDRELDSFMAYVVRCTTLNVVEADGRANAQGVFHTVNDRGRQLSAADNIKCDLLENSRLKSDEADAAARKWEELEDQLGRENFAKLLSLMPFLLIGGEMVAPTDLTAFRERVEVAGGVHSFLFEKLPRYAVALSQILHLNVEAGSVSADINRRIKMMMQIDDEWAWAPAALAAVAQHSGSPENLRRVFQALDGYAFACELAAVDIKMRTKRFALAARMAGEEKVYMPGGPLALTDPESLHLISRLNAPFRRDRALRRLVMLRIEAAMPGGSILSIRDDVTVEHVAPRGRGDPYWATAFPDQRRREEEANLIGNLVLVTERQNKDADDKPFPKKKDIYFNTPGAPVHAVTKMIANVDHWTHEIISQRQEALVRRVCDDWGVFANQKPVW